MFYYPFIPRYLFPISIVTQTQNTQDLHLQTQRFIYQFHNSQLMYDICLDRHLLSPTEKGNIVLVMNGYCLALPIRLNL